MSWRNLVATNHRHRLMAVAGVAGSSVVAGAVLLLLDDDEDNMAITRMIQ